MYFSANIQQLFYKNGKNFMAKKSRSQRTMKSKLYVSTSNYKLCLLDKKLTLTGRRTRTMEGGFVLQYLPLIPPY